MHLHGFLIFFIITFFLCNSYCFAEPAPLGIEIGKATLKDIEKNHKIIEKNKALSDGKAIILEPGSFPLKGLKKVFCYVDKDEIVQAITLVLSKDKFDDMVKTLSEKYTLVSKQLPFVGDKEVHFKEGDSVITILAPHMSFNMEIYYASKNFDDALNERIAQSITNQQETGKSLL